MKHLNGPLELCHVHRAVRPAGVVRAYLPNRFSKAAQYLRAFMRLPDLRLVQRKAESLSDRRWKALQTIKRIHKPNQRPRGFRVLRHHIQYMLKLA